MVPLSHYLALAAILFGIGLYGALARRNAISVLMCTELMLNAANINLVAFSRYLPAPAHGAPLGQVFVVFTIAIAAAEVTVGLAIVLALYRMRRSVKLDDMNLLKG
jgi:NADH-quinone oxidoreductase subunit K